MATLAAMSLPSAAVAAPAAPELSFEPASQDFGLQPLYNGSQGTLQLRNDGSEGVWLESLNVVGPGSGTFWVGNSTCWGAPVEPGAACSIDVYFNPSEPIAYEAQLRASVAGTDFYADLSGEGGSPRFVPDANPVDFGVAKVGAEGNTREIVVTNEGNWPGGVFIAVISGGAVASYQLLDESCTGRVLYPADSCTVQVRFRPIAEGVKKATLSLFGESDGGTQIALTGTGAAPEPASPPDVPSASDSFASAPAAVGPGAITVVVPRAERDRAAIRERKRRHRLERKRRTRRLRALRKRRTSLRHRPAAQASVRDRAAIGG